MRPKCHLKWDEEITGNDSLADQWKIAGKVQPVISQKTPQIFLVKHPK